MSNQLVTININIGLEFVDEVFTIAILLSFSLYYLLIYFGRNKFSNEKYNYYLSLISFIVALYIFVELVAEGFEEYLPAWFNRPLIEIFLGSLSLYGFIQFFTSVFNYPRERMKYFYVTVVSLSAVLLTTIYAFYDYYRWVDLFFKTVVIVFNANILLTIIVFIKWINEKKLYKNKIFVYIVIGLFFMLFNMIIIKTVLAVNREAHFRHNYFLVNIGIIFISYGLSVKWKLEFLELTELKENLEKRVVKRTEELNIAKQEIEKTSKEKVKYFINLAHETKTPITLLSNYFEQYLKKDPNNAELNIVKRNIDNLKRNIVNFMDAEKLEKGITFYNNDLVVNLSKLIEDKILLFKSLSKSKQISLLFDIKKDLYTCADPHALDKIIDNLISNSIKYTNNKGCVKVGLYDENEQIYFKVWDNGIGIKSEKIEYLFQPYYQISSDKQNIDGLGMGLHIVNQIVTNLNGTISVESSFGEYTLFTVQLKAMEKPKEEQVIDYIVEKPVDIIPNEKSVLELPKSNTLHKLLIVEDNIEMLNYLRSQLSEHYLIDAAFNGIEALKKLKEKNKPDVVLSDIMMDGIDGIELFNTIIDDDDLNHIPFLFITARNAESEKIKLLTKGATDYIQKPFSFKELTARLHSAIQNKINHQKKAMVSAIQLINNGIASLDNTAEEFNSNRRNFMENCLKFDITDRQKEIIQYVSEGLEYKQIADKMFISPRTVIRHIQNIFEKVNVHNKVELIKVIYG